MSESHRDHLRGDEVAGRGFGYECLWRCRLLLRLALPDSLSIYQGEDALIYLATRANWQKSYYQVKHTTTQWTPKKLQKFLKRAISTLADDENTSYVFCTNVSQTPTLRTTFAEINAKYGKPSKKGTRLDRLKYEVWVLDPDDPTDKIRNALSGLLKRHFKPRQIANVLRDGDLETCCNKLLALEARLKLTAEPSLTGKQVWEQAGLQELAASIPSFILGDRLFSWPSWVQYAKDRNSDPTLSATRSLVADLGGFALDLEDRLFGLAQQWLNSPTNSMLHLITGPSGAGKTWLLIRLGLRLSPIVPVYWADDLSAGADPALADVPAWEGKPVIVLIDNLIEAEWGHLIPASLRARPPILIIGTTAKPRYSHEVLPTKERVGQKCVLFDLGPVLTGDEISRLVTTVRRGTAAVSERKQLESSTIRSAISLLTGQQTDTDLTDRLFSLWRRNDCQPWVTPLLLCSSLGIKIPKSVLRDHARRSHHARRELPDDLWPLVLHAKRENDDEEQIWLGDAHVAAKVVAAVENETAPSHRANIFVNEATTLSASVQPQSPTHRRFARRIIREFSDSYPSHGPALFEQWKNTIMALLPFETRAAIAYGWLPYLPQMERKAEAKRAAEEFVATGPDSVAEVILMMEAFGNHRAKQAIEDALRTANRWHTDPWASFIEQLRPLPGQGQKELLALGVPLLQSAPLDFRKLLDTRNVAVDLITAIKDNGQAEHREWLMTLLETTALPAPCTTESLSRVHLINSYLPLVERCIGQARNRLVLITIRHLLTALHGKSSLDELYGTTYDLYKSAYQEEQRKSYHVRALTRALHYLDSVADSAPTMATNIWPTVLDFASKWADPASRSEIDENSYEFLRLGVERGLLPKLFEKVFLACGRDLIANRSASQPKLRTLLGFFQNPPATHAQDQLILILSGAVLKQEPPAPTELVGKARSLLKTYSLGHGGDAIELANKFLKELAREVHAQHVKPLAGQQTAALAQPVVIDLLYCIGTVSWSEDEQQELAAAIHNRWGHSLPLNVVLTLFRLGAKQESKATIEALLSEKGSDPDALLLAASWEARFGSPKLSEDRIIDALESYLRTSEGAHPPQIWRAYRDLAQRSSSPKREVLELCAALQRQGQLTPLITSTTGI